MEISASGTLRYPPSGRPYPGQVIARRICRARIMSNGAVPSQIVENTALLPLFFISGGDILL
jgi:hypothetical protein